MTPSPTCRRCARTWRSPMPRASCTSSRPCTSIRSCTLDRWLAAHHTLGLVAVRLLRQRPFRGHARGARVVVVAAGRHLPAAAQLARARERARRSLVFWLYPVAPPRMLAGFTDVVASTHAFGSWHTGALASHANQFAAMPSLHMAWAAWCTLALWRATKRAWVRALAAALSVPDGARRAGDRQPLPAGHRGRARGAGRGGVPRAPCPRVCGRAAACAPLARRPAEALRNSVADGVADVTNLLRSPRTGRHAGAAADARRRLRRWSRGASTGPPHMGGRTFSSVCRVALRTCQTSIPTRTRSA